MDQQKTETIQVTTKDPKKVEAGKRLAEYNRKKREELKSSDLSKNKAQTSEPQNDQQAEYSDFYGVGAVIAVGVIGGLGYYIYQSKKSVVHTSNDIPILHKSQSKVPVKVRGHDVPSKFDME